MRFKNPSLWIAAFSASAVVGFVLSDIGQRPSPGPLAEVHGREDDLAGKSDCSECHGGWRETMSEACLACHEDVGRDVEQRSGLHGVIDREKALECGPCHSEHHGAAFQMVNEQSFAAAGVPAVDQFDHDRIGWTMDGRHLEIACQECHVHVDAAVLPRGTRRFMGLDLECSRCHEDPHNGRMALACVDCHGQRDFKAVFFADHGRHLPLIGGHGDVGCRACHAPNEPHALEALGRQAEPPPRDCADCHESPHSRDFVQGVAALAARPPAASCGDCHRPEHHTFVSGDIEVTREQHARSSMPLDPPHDRAACDACHSDRFDDFAARYPGRTAGDCGRCHADVHAGQFDVGPFAVRRCTECHDLMQFDPHTYTRERHALSDFKLTGAHLETGCDQCHRIPDEGSPRSFHGTPFRCEQCHGDAHGGFFDPFLRKESVPRQGSCAACHLTTKFSALPRRGFDHARWTDYPLLGAHAQAECASCHPHSRQPDRFGRTFGRVAQRFGKLDGCATCHPDVHRGVFDGADRPRRVGSRTGCARCHDETSFRTVSTEFDHGVWTGYVLDGAHGRVGCAGCHPTRRQPDESGRTFSRAKGTACADCHEDPHAGQFLREGQTDCRRCHRSATGFSDLYFKHNVHSRYRLDVTHASVACSGCHRTVREGGLDFVRYRPLGMECADCHASPQDALRRRKEKHE